MSIEDDPVGGGTWAYPRTGTTVEGLFKDSPAAD
jgi:hypothetical protein